MQHQKLQTKNLLGRSVEYNGKKYSILACYLDERNGGQSIAITCEPCDVFSRPLGGVPITIWLDEIVMI